MTAVLAVVFGILVVLIEAKRQKPFCLDFLRGVSCALVLAYSIVPIIFVYYKYNVNPARFYWIDLINYQDSYLNTMALFIVFIGYTAILSGYIWALKFPFVKNSARFVYSSLSRISRKTYLFIAIFISMVSLVLLIAYVVRRQADLATLLRYSGALRVGQPVPGIAESSFTLLTWSMTGITATFILFGLLLDNQTRVRGRRRCRNFLLSNIIITILFFLMVIVSLIVLWMRAGRLHLGNFFLVFALLVFLYTSSRFVRIFSFALVSVIAWVILVAGKYLLGIAPAWYQPEAGSDFLQLFALEFSFPFLSLINAVDQLVSYRVFLDYLIAPVYTVLPPIVKIVTGSNLSLINSVAKENTSMILGTTALGEIPVDIITFGYFNLNVPGVIVTGFLFGAGLAWMEQVFPENTQGVLRVLRISYIVFLSTIGTLYADPVNVLRDGFYLIFPTALLITVGALTKRPAPRWNGMRRSSPLPPCK